MTVTRGLYQHFKGGFYVVLDLGFQVDGDTEVPVVMYEASYAHTSERPKIFVRTLHNFTERVVRDGYDGPRFVAVPRVGESAASATEVVVYECIVCDTPGDAPPARCSNCGCMWLRRKVR